MTIASTTSKASYSGNGSTTAFSIPFYFIANADIVAVLVSALGVEDTLTLTTDYTLSGAGNPSGGTLTMLTAPATGETLVIKRSPDQVQETVYVENDPFPAKAHEMGLDRLTMMVQDLQEQVDRSVKVGLLGGDPDDLIDDINQAVSDSASSAASALAAKTAAETAQAAAEAAAASVPVDALRSGNNLSDLDNAGTARTNLGLGDAATKNVGTTAGTVAAGDDARFSAGAADTAARNLAVRNALKFGISASDASGSIPSGYLHLFATDELATKTNALYDSTNKLYYPFATIPQATGTPIGDLTANGGLAAAFDGTNVQLAAACAKKAGASSGNIGKDWGAGNTKVVGAFTLYGPSDISIVNSQNFTVKLQGSTDNFSSSIVDLYTSGTQTTATNFVLSVTSGITTTTAYRYHRLLITPAGGVPDIYASEVIFSTLNANMTLIPSAITAGASPKSINFYMLHKAVDSVTLNVDLKDRVTLDGTNWSGYGILEDLGQYDTNYKLLHAEIDTSALTGTSGIKWEITTLNTKAQQVRAAAMLLNF